MIQIDKKLINDLFDKAVVSDRKRMNYDLRTSSNDGSQRMLNALLPGSIVPIHRHPYSNENVILLCGKLVEVLYDEEGNETGNLIVLKKDPNVYKMVHQTRSHTVLVPVSDTNGTVAGDLVKVITNGMLNMKGFGPAGTAQGIEMRFSGEFAEKFPQYMPGYEGEAPTAE